MILSVTGHRPNKLGGYTTAAINHRNRIAMIALEELKPELVLTGMALGWDTAIALACIHKDIPFHACVPFIGQESQWPTVSKSLYEFILSKAARVVIVSEGGFSARKMQVRNQYVVDNSEQVAALWDGTNGGTGNCIQYACDVNRPIKNYYQLWSVGMENISCQP